VVFANLIDLIDFLLVDIGIDNLYASAKNGIAKMHLDDESDNEENDDESGDDITLPEETDTSDIDFDTDTDDDIKTPDVKEEEEDNKDEDKKDEKLEQEPFSNLRISFPNYMGIDRAPNATVRIMESIGSLYNLYIAMNNKSQSKDSLYQESISSEIADALKKIQEPLQGVFSAFTLNPSHPEISFETLTNVIEMQKSTFYRVVNSISIFILGLSSGVYTASASCLSFL
jgi:hypothetical protein